MGRVVRIGPLAFLAAALLVSAVAAATADLGPQERLAQPTHFGVAGVEVAGGGRRDRYLAAWLEVSEAGEAEVFARAVDESGQPRGPVSQVSQMGPAGDRTYSAGEPAISYNPRRDDFVIAWSGNGESEAREACTPVEGALPPAPGESPPGCYDTDSEIYVRRVAPDGSPEGPQRRVTETGPHDCVSCEALMPRLAYDSAHGTYVVAFAAWESPDRPAVQVQRLTGRGAQAERRERNVATTRLVSFGMGDLVYDPADRQFFVLHFAGPEIQQSDVYINRLDARGRPLGVRNRIISAGDEARDTRPRIAVVPGTRRMLATWEVQRPGVAEMRAVVRELGDNGAPAGPVVELPGRNFNPQPVAQWDATQRRFLVAWVREQDDDREVYGSFLTADPQLDQSNPFRVSKMGPDPGPNPRDYTDFAYDPALTPRDGGLLVVWNGYEEREGGHAPYARSVRGG